MCYIFGSAMQLYIYVLNRILFQPEKYEKSLGIARQTIDCLKVYINGMQHSCNNELHYETYLHCSVIWLWFWLNIKRHSVLCLCMWIEGGGRFTSLTTKFCFCFLNCYILKQWFHWVKSTGGGGLSFPLIVFQLCAWTFRYHFSSNRTTTRIT